METAKKILLFSRDPGGANTVIPLVEPLKEKGYEVLVFGKDAALKKYQAAGIKAIDIMDHLNGISLVEVGYFLDGIAPDFIITGTSADDFVEKYIWDRACKKGIKTFAILDQWVNYGVRFSPYTSAELDRYNQDKRHEYQPFKILVMDEYAKDEMLKEGFETDRLVVTGQPHFDYIKAMAQSLSEKERFDLRSRLNIKNSQKTVLFASEPITECYGDINSRNYWGYTEIGIFLELADACKNIQANEGVDIKLILRPHPKEKPDKIEDMIKSIEGELDIAVEYKEESLMLASISDVVTGLSSMLLIEAMIIGKPILSIQIGLSKTDPFVFSRKGITSTVLDRGSLYGQLRDLLVLGTPQNHSYKFPESSVENVINCMEKWI
ncbi:MAG: hypothetical protein FIA99_12395 [Ruminiclostridium sp.]|nr:hypothetical protein [Ruminiclostridium sp.]